MFAVPACFWRRRAVARLRAGFSPQVETTDADTVILDIDGLGNLFGTVHEIAYAMAGRADFPVNIAIASNPDAAFHAARDSQHQHRARRRRSQISGEPATHLALAREEIAETLARWGIRAFRDLDALPDLGVAARLAKKACGCKNCARRKQPSAQTGGSIAALRRNHGARVPGGSDRAADVRAGAIAGGCLRASRGTGAGGHRAASCLQLENAGEHARAIRLPVPMRSSRVFLKLLELDLENIRRGADRQGHAGGRACKAARHTERIIHSARARAGKTGADAGAYRGGGGRWECRLA